LGEPLAAVQQLILGQGMRLIAVALAWIAARCAGSFLYGIDPHDQITFTTTPIFLAAIALVASWIRSPRRYSRPCDGASL